MSRKLAEDIVNMLKYNQHLSHEDKILAIELRLNRFAEDVEKACEQAQMRQKETLIIVDERPQDIPVLARAMLAQQAQRGPTN